MNAPTLPPSPSLPPLPLGTTTRTTRVHWPLWLALISLVLYSLVAWQSPGFDDEFTNMALIEHLGTWKTAALMQTEDVHPPLGYVFNGLLHTLLGHWPAVRVVSATLYAVALWQLLVWVQATQGLRAMMLVFLMAGLSPTTLMWCTSLRWYAYFTPLLMWAIVPASDRYPRWQVIKPALAWLMLAHISYAALVLAPVLWIWHGLQQPQGLLHHARRSWWAWALAGLAYIPQGWIFLTVHNPQHGGQIFGLGSSLMGVFISMAGNQGVFPLSIGAIASALAWLVLMVTDLREPRMPGHRSAMWVTVFGAVLFVATGLAGKFRNLAVLVPWQALWLGQMAPALARRRYTVWALAALTLGQGIGLYNVVRHEDTAKNSWNLPVAEVLDTIDRDTRDCHGTVAAYAYDSVLAEALHAHRPDWSVANFYGRFDRTDLPTQADCTVVLETYKGALSARQFQALHDVMRRLQGEAGTGTPVGDDAHAALKQRMDPSFPRHPVIVHTCVHPNMLNGLNDWVLSGRTPQSSDAH